MLRNPFRTTTTPTRISSRWLAGASAIFLASGWVGAGLNRLLGQPHSMESPGTLLWLVTPLATVLALRLTGRAVSDGGWRPRLRENWGWYLFAFAPYPALALAAVAVGAASSLVSLDLRPATLAAAVATAFGPALLKNIFEESVWRGYLTGEMAKRGWNDWLIYLVAGGIWGLWHLPYYAFFLPAEQRDAVAAMPWPVFAGLACLTIILWGVLFTELYRVTGSIWPVVILHAVEDAVINPLVIDGHVQFARGTEWLFSPIIGLIPAAALAAAGLWVRSRRRR